MRMMSPVLSGNCLTNSESVNFSVCSPSFAGLLPVSSLTRLKHSVGAKIKDVINESVLPYFCSQLKPLG